MHIVEYEPGRKVADMLARTEQYFRTLEDHLKELGTWQLEDAEELREAADILRQIMATGRESATLARMLVETRR